MPYELLTGDLSQVNYSSIRAGLVEFRRTDRRRAMADLFIPMFCQPVWDWFTAQAWAAGRLPQGENCGRHGRRRASRRSIR